MPPEPAVKPDEAPAPAPTEAPPEPVEAPPVEAPPKETPSAVKPAEKVPEEAPWAPEDWRQHIAGEDEKRLSALARYNSMADWADSWFEQRKKIAAGDRPVLPEDPTEEQLTEWREKAGLPTKVEDYQVDLGEGVVLGVDDEAMVEAIREAAFAENVEPQRMSRIAQRWVQEKQKLAEQRYQQDNYEAQETRKFLSDNWGADLEANLNILRQDVAEYSEEFAKDMMETRLPDGRALFNAPEFLTREVEKLRRLDPMATLMPTGRQSSAALTDELESIKKMMGDASSEYWKGPKAKGLQERFRALIEQQERIEKARAKLDQ